MTTVRTRGGSPIGVCRWRSHISTAYLAELSDNVVADFVKLLDTQILYNEAAAIFATSPVATQSRIVDALKDADEELPTDVREGARSRGHQC